MSFYRYISSKNQRRNYEQYRDAETPINSALRSAELIDLAGEQRQGLMRECITASSDSQMQVFRFPCRIDAFIIGVGTEGETTSVSFNLHEFRLKKDSMFIFTPKNILQVNSQQYFKADVIAISPDFMRRINIDIKNMMPLFLQIRIENHHIGADATTRCQLACAA